MQLPENIINSKKKNSYNRHFIIHPFKCTFTTAVLDYPISTPIHYACYVHVYLFCKSKKLKKVRTKYPGATGFLSLRLAQYATSTFPIMHLVCPPKFCLSIVFNFAWDGFNTQEKWKTKVMQNLGRGNKVHYGKCGSGVYSLIGNLRSNDATASRTLLKK